MESIIERILAYHNEKDYTHLSDKAYDILVELIITCSLEPGMLYPESDLVNMIGIGRTPIREAIKRLEFLKVLQVLPRYGILISNLHSEDAKLEREVRCAIESLIIQKTASYSFPHERQRLLELKNLYVESCWQHDYLTVVRSDLQFHLTCALYARNAYAQNTLLPFLISESRIYYLVATSPREQTDELIRLHEKHAEMMQYIIDGEPQKAVDALKESAFSSFLYD